jgi:hypothetical protein
LFSRPITALSVNDLVVRDHAIDPLRSRSPRLFIALCLSQPVLSRVYSARPSHPSSRRTPRNLLADCSRVKRRPKAGLTHMDATSRPLHASPNGSSGPGSGALGAQSERFSVDMTPRLFSAKSAKIIGGVELGGPAPKMHRGSSLLGSASEGLSGSDTDEEEDENGGAAHLSTTRRDARGTPAAAAAAGQQGANVTRLSVFVLTICLVAIVVRRLISWVSPPPPPPPPPPPLTLVLATGLASRPVAAALLVGMVASCALFMKLMHGSHPVEEIDGHIVMQLRDGKRFRA